MSHKWKSYRPLFYLSPILTILLLFILTFYVLITPAPRLKSSTIDLLFLKNSIIPIRLTIIGLAGLNLFKIILEIILYRGLRVPFAQLFGIISFLTSIIAFTPYNRSNEMFDWQWELAACSTLFQWLNTAVILRSVPFVGNVIVMFQSVLINFVSLIFVIFPLLIAFTIATQMIFYNHSSFLTITVSMHKLSAMLIGEFGFEDLFFSKPIFPAATFIFIPFIAIMTTIFMNLLLGLTVGDIQICMENARAKASMRFKHKILVFLYLKFLDAYRIRELIYIESTLPSISWLRKNVVDNETIDVLKDSILTKENEQDKEENEDNYNESLSNRQRISELEKLFDIVNKLSSQAKQVLEQENHLEIILKQLLSARKTHE